MSKAPTSEPGGLTAKVFVKGLTLEAEIGVYAHERGRRQPLIVDVELEVVISGGRSIEGTVNYERIGEHARAIAAAGHIGLVETFAWRLAQACLSEPRVRSARVRVEKPLALAPQAAAAGVEVRLQKD
jgi:dihydroneopterin aldolase